jgi:hypothetical protein
MRLFSANILFYHMYSEELSLNYQHYPGADVLVLPCCFSVVSTELELKKKLSAKDFSMLAAAGPQARVFRTDLQLRRRTRIFSFLPLFIFGTSLSQA